MLHLTANNFESTASQSSLPVIVMFYAVWCSKCSMMKPIVEDIETRYKTRILFCEADIDESSDLAAHYQADIVPTFVFFQNGTYLRTLKGVFSETTFERQLQKIFRNY